MLGAAIFNPIATEGPGFMESPLVSIVKTASTPSTSTKSSGATAVATPKVKPVLKAPKSLQEQGYDFDDSLAAKKEVRTHVS